MTFQQKNQECNDYGQVLRTRAEQQPDRLAYIYLENGNRETQRFTYKDLDRRVRSIAQAMQSRGLSGEQLILLMSSDLDYFTSFLACLYAGTIAVTATLPKTAAQLDRANGILENAQSHYIIVKRASVDRLRAMADRQSPFAKATWLIFEDLLLEGKAEEWVEPNSNEEDVALLQYTSGSTSNPKGVMVTHRNLQCIGGYHEEIFGMNSDDFGVTWLPQFHDMGLIFGLLQPLYSGYPCCVMSPMSFIKRPLRWLQAISDYRATVSIVPNFAYDLCSKLVTPEELVNLHLEQFTLAINGAEPIRPQTIDRFLKTFEEVGMQYRSLKAAYGMAETTLAVTSTRREKAIETMTCSVEQLEKGLAVPAVPGEKSREVVGCGKSGREVDIVILNSSTMEACPAGVVGEVLIRGSIVSPGYWNNTEATIENFGTYLKDGTGPYLRTGDLAFLDDRDELYLVGRCKDLIIINGKNHAPQDIEITVENSDPAIRSHQVSAFSIDVEGQEVVVAIAELERQYAALTDPTALGKLVAKKVTLEHQVPVFEVVFVKRGETPKTTSGKIQRQRSKNLYLNREYNIIGRYRNPMFKKVSLFQDIVREVAV